MKRFEDTGKSLYSYFDRKIVCCPKCLEPIDLADDRIACLHCGYSKIFESHGTSFFRVLETGLKLKYFLEIDCCNHRLTAVNVNHLNFIKEYVESDLRERIPNVNQSMASRLPQWIKDKKNRSEILKCIQKLYKSLEKSGYRLDEKM